jgi:hypothetical protein
VNKLFAVAAAFLLAGCSLFEHRYQSEDGKFSYPLPGGWTTHEFPGQKYRVASGNGEGPYSANMIVVAVDFDGPLQVFVEGSKATIEGMFGDFQLMGEGLFDTDSGLKGFKLVGKGSQMGFPLEQAWYFFPGKGEYFAVTASALQADFDQQEKVFDRSMKAFTLR